MYFTSLFILGKYLTWEMHSKSADVGRKIIFRYLSVPSRDESAKIIIHNAVIDIVIKSSS
jgi:hypothetical protein